MTQPTFAKRLAGRPPVTAVLFLFYGLLIIGWLKGGVPWWLALIAMIGVSRTFRSWRDLRRYNTWLASWQEMGADDTAAQRPPAKQRAAFSMGRAAVIVALMLAIALPVGFKGSAPSAGVLWLWAGACLFLVGKAVYRVVRVGRRIVARPARQAVKAETAGTDAPVTWLLPRASSSPSRADAALRLPEYSARLITERQHGIVRY